MRIWTYWPQALTMAGAAIIFWMISQPGIWEHLGMGLAYRFGFWQWFGLI